MHPAPDRGADEPGDERAGQDPERDRERQAEGALAGVDDRRRVGPVVVEVVEDVAEPAAERSRPGTTPTTMNSRSSDSQARRRDVRARRPA